MTMHLSRRRAVAAVHALAICLASLACGCASASVVRLGGTQHAARAAASDVEIHDLFTDLPRPHDKVGRVVGEGSDFVSFAAIVAEMCVRTREVGGDALVLTGGGLLLDGDGEHGIDCDRTVHGVAVRWR